MQKKWSSKEIEELERLIDIEKKDITFASRKLNRTYDSVKHAIRRYGIGTNSEDSDLFFDSSNPKKLTYTQLTGLSKYLGQKIVDNYHPIKIKEPKPKKSKIKKEEHSILDISDVHWGMINKVFDSDVGKAVVTYNIDIAKQELEKLQRGIFKIYDILKPSYKLRELTINIMGDIITNDRIFEEQTFEIEKVVGLQIWDVINYFSQFFVNLLNLYEKINVVCTVGNHGRSNPSHYSEVVENNFEYFIYKVWEKQFIDSKRINIIVPDSRRYIYNIYDWKHLIEHGDSLRGFSANYIQKQIKDLSLNVGGFHVMHHGHFHKLNETEIADKVIVKHNGCWIWKDSYGFKLFKSYSMPKQWFFGCSPKRVETWSYKIDLRV